MENMEADLKYYEDKVWELRQFSAVGCQSENKMENVLFKKLHEELGYLANALDSKRKKLKESTQSDAK